MEKRDCERLWKRARVKRYSDGVCVHCGPQFKQPRDTVMVSVYIVVLNSNNQGRPFAICHTLSQVCVKQGK